MSNKLFPKFLILFTWYTIFSFPSHADAAQMIDMRYQPDALNNNSLMDLPANTKHKPTYIEFKAVKHEVDGNGITHVRYQEFYKGIPVWGGETIRHTPAKSQLANSNGIIFQDLQADLPGYPPAQADISAAEEQVVQSYKNETGTTLVSMQHDNPLFVYIDENNKAHWAVHVKLLVADSNKSENPNYLVDAINYKIYQKWNGINFLDNVKGGGFGGNQSLGMNTYDGLPNNKPALDMLRDNATATCYLENSYVVIKDGRTVTGNNPDTAVTMSFQCPQVDPQHGKIYWDGALDETNGAWSPSNDALYLMDKVNAMYQEWFNIPVLSDQNKRMKISVRVHNSVIPGGLNLPIPGVGNAGWDMNRQEVVFGDNTGFWGDSSSYPFVIPGVMAHELSHGFTQQHSDLFQFGEPGALNESFSDMADAAFDYYLTGNNTWMAATGINKDGSGLRYLNNPPKDGTSIDNAQTYYQKTSNKDISYFDVHDASGIFNKVFYLMSQSKELGGLGNPKLAFEVMVQANKYHWTSFYLKFNEAACGIWDSARDLNYSQKDLDNITQIMSQVGLNTSNCHW
jgi:pseudolysin